MATLLRREPTSKVSMKQGGGSNSRPCIYIYSTIFIQHPEITVRIQDEVLALRTYYNNYLGVDKARSGHFLYLIFTLLTQFSISRLTTWKGAWPMSSRAR